MKSTKHNCTISLLKSEGISDLCVFDMIVDMPVQVKKEKHQQEPEKSVMARG